MRPCSVRGHCSCVSQVSQLSDTEVHARLDPLGQTPMATHIGMGGRTRPESLAIDAAERSSAALPCILDRFRSMPERKG